MDFSENWTDFFYKLKSAKYRAFIIACFGIGFIGYALYVFAWALSPQVYAGGF